MAMTNVLCAIMMLVGGSQAAPVEPSRQMLIPNPNSETLLEPSPHFLSSPHNLCSHTCATTHWDAPAHNTKTGSVYSCGKRILHRAEKEFSHCGSIGSVVEACSYVAEKFSECSSCMPAIPHNKAIPCMSSKDAPLPPSPLSPPPPPPLLSPPLPPASPPLVESSWSFGAKENGDLVAIKKANTGCGKTEVHILSASSNYQNFVLQTCTTLHTISDPENWAFLVKSNGDVVVVKQKNTGSSSTEVHILDASSNYGSFSLQTGTALHETDYHWAFAVSGKKLVSLKLSNTGSGMTEVHAMKQNKNYGSFYLQTGTGLHEIADPQNYAFGLKGNKDLVVIKKANTGCGKTEVHILSASSNYQNFVLQTCTALHETGSSFSFVVKSNGDIMALSRGPGTGSGSTEVHILSASSNYGSFSLQTGTGLHETPV